MSLDQAEERKQTLAQLRQEIDTLDAELVRLLNARAQLAIGVRSIKERDQIQVYVPERERQILDRVAKLAQGGAFPARHLKRIFLNILSATRSLIGDLQVCFVGPEFSVAHQAGLAQFGEHLNFEAVRSPEEVFARVERGDATFGIVPASVAGTGFYSKTFELLLESSLRIIAEVEIKERLALLSCASQLGEVQVVYGLPAHFELARTWFAANLAQAQLQVRQDLRQALETLAAAQNTAVLALDSVPLEQFAEHQRIKALATGLEQTFNGEVRCVVIGDTMTSSSGRDKTTLACAVSDRAGALRDVLQPFAEHGVTLLKIESRPLRARPGEFIFFIDLLGHHSEARVSAAIEKVTPLCSVCKVLGSYPLVCYS